MSRLCQRPYCRIARIFSVCVLSAVLVAVWLCCGCASYQYGPARVTSFGVDPTVESFSWVKTDTTEAIEIHGVKRTGGEAGTHMIGNVACTLIGAAVGSAVGPAGTAAGAAKGAAVGMGTGEIWQTLKDWIGKKSGGKGIAGK
jgi:hypothetical protein